MASIKDLKRRIGSTKNTQQTTKAMKMVSAAKLRRAQEAITAQRPYAKGIMGLIDFLSKNPSVSGDAGGDSPVLKRELPEGKKPRLLLVLVTSDRGLAGGFNSYVNKTAQRWMKENGSQYESIKLAFLGKKGFDFWKIRHKDLGENFSDLTGKVTFAKAKEFSARLMKFYLDGEVDEIKIIYNEFKNAVSQVVQIEPFLPLGGLTEDAENKKGSAEERPSVASYIIKPGAKAVMDLLLAKHFATQTFRIMLESQASEHGARMSAMENATKNAEEMVRMLTLQYNKQRQAGITKELLEIIAGSESQKTA